jgi:hypothetical protein
LAAAVGQDAIFYDSWSIQPGDGIIEQMNAGLADCKVFFFFVSKKSLQSKMVKLEWQNALLKATNGETRIVPVKIDDVLMPNILLQTLYIDLFGQGLETAVRQMIDVASGRNVYRSAPQRTFENIRAYVTRSGLKITLEFRAEAYMEPHSQFLILLDNAEGEVAWTAPGEAMFNSGFNPKLTLSNGATFGAIGIGRASATSPGFPFIVELTPKGAKPVEFRGAMRLRSRDQYCGIPVIEVRTT